MSDFGTVTPLRRPTDPYKRVQYSRGLVLGVEEFEQDQAYFIERDRQHQRVLHGYGTACGLALSVRTPVVGEPEIVVSAGLAVAPNGETIRVPAAQCARLNDWLARNADQLRTYFGSPVGTVVADVRLCARACSTDAVPIPGGPCRSQQDAMKPSRWADDFELSLVPVDPTASPPPSLYDTEEEIARLFGELLGRIVVDTTGPFTTADDLLALIRSLDDEVGSPLSSPLPVPPRIVLDPVTAEETLRRALRVWVTEVRPNAADAPRACADGAARSACVSLGQLVLDVAADLTVTEADVTIDESARAILLSTRVIQEWPLGQILAGLTGLGGSGVSAHSALTGLGADDHPQYLLASGARALGGDLSAGGHRLTNLAAAAGAGEAVRFEQAVKAGDPAAGDLSGTYPAPVVRALQGRAVTAVAPVNGQSLAFDGVQWGPAFQVGAAAGLVRLMAAGQFTAAGIPIGLVYNSSLVVTRVGATTEYVATFGGYANPLVVPTRMYVITGLVGISSAADAAGHFQFERFANDGIHFRASANSTTIALTPNRSFMLQIIGYGAL